MKTIDREQLLAGVTRLNKGDYEDARETSETVEETIGKGVEGGVNGEGDRDTRDPGDSLTSDTADIPASQVSLESILKAKVDGGRKAIRALTEEITTHAVRLTILKRRRKDAQTELNLVRRILEEEYGYDKEGKEGEGDAGRKEDTRRE